MAQSNRQFEIVYSQEEMERALESMISQGYRNEDIHVLANDKNLVNEAHDRYGVDAHKANSFANRIKILLTGEDIARAKLAEFGLGNEAIEHYEREIERGAVLLYSDGTPSETGENEHFSTHADDNSPMDLEKNDRDIDRDGKRHRETGVEGIYATDATREETNKSQLHSKSQDSRLKGDEIHPTSDRVKPEVAEKPEEKRMEHEPKLGTDEGEEELNREEGVNRRQDESSPGVDPNLGPAPFGRDSEEEHLTNDEADRRDDYESPRSPKDVNDFHNNVEKKTGTPPTPRLF